MIDVYGRMDGIFSQADFYLAFVTTYPGGNWSFLMGTCGTSQLPFCRDNFDILTRYYTPQLHLASFVLPRFLQEALEK
jgi:spermidine synthase